MKKTLFLVPVVVAVFLSGCAATAGNEALKDVSQQTIDAKITEGKSTKADVQAAYGAPNKVSYDNGLEVWNYEYARATPQAVNFIPVVNLFARAADVNKKTLTVLFDDKGVVKKYSYAASQNVVKGGLAAE